MAPSTQWADGPFALISTPGERQQTPFPNHVFMAREMAYAHNGMLRALNSIYNQATSLPPSLSIRCDFLKYISFWCGWLHEHHENEETFLFPRIESLTEQKGLMSQNIAEHHAFEAGLEELTAYASSTTPAEYDGVKVRLIIDSFGSVLTQHLTDEIATLLNLSRFPNPAMKAAWMFFEKKARQGDTYTLYPLVMGTSDKNYGGESWPAVPFFVRYLVHYWHERKWKGVWRFNPSDTWGLPQPLAFGEGHGK